MKLINYYYLIIKIYNPSIKKYKYIYNFNKLIIILIYKNTL